MGHAVLLRVLQHRSVVIRERKLSQANLEALVLQKFLHANEAVVVFVNDAELPPAEGLQDVHVGLRQRRRVRVQVDRVGVPREPEVPSVLDVRDLQGVTDRLHVS